MDTVISAIAIDLGSKYTGVFQCDYQKGESLQKQHCQSYTLVLPQTGFSQQPKRATRHQVRRNHRRKMVKRLFGLAFNQLCKRFDVHLTRSELKKATEASNGLINRRGYNRLLTELDENLMKT